MKKRMVTVLLAGMMALSLFGCGGSEDKGDRGGTNEGGTQEDAGVPKEEESQGEDASAEGKEVSIQFMHTEVEQERQDVIAQIITAFEEENPNIKVEQIPVNDADFGNKIVAMGGAGELPEVVAYLQAQAKVSASNEFIDYEAVNGIIEQIGADKFYEGVLEVVKTEDGADYTGVPLIGWTQGIWVNTGMLEEKGLTVPETWEDVLNVAKEFHDPDSKVYGVALPTDNALFTEQVFSQFALSNGANVYDAEGNIVFDSPEMKEAAEFYKELADYTMSGAVGVPEVKDAFISQSTPMALYSTYIIDAIIEAGFIEDVQLVFPKRTEAAAYGDVTVLSVTADLEEEQRAAAEKFISYMMEPENNVSWISMAPGGTHPVRSDVKDSEAYGALESVKKFEHLSEQISYGLDSLKMFGVVGDKNFLSMGDISNTGVISETLYNIILQGQMCPQR